MNVDFRHIITLIIASLISFTANADMLRPSSRNFSDIFATTTDRYQYSGKEFDRMNGLDHYDFHARQYDPVLGRFTTPDPLSEKYYHLSPYAYCASNPLRYIDPTGKDITVLNYGHGANQHLALLIQNAESQWEYYSFNGTSFYNTTKGLVGGLSYNNLGEKYFDSPQSFLNSSYNSDGSVSDEEKGNVNGYGFTEGYVIKTSPEQDSKIRQGFIDAVNEGYDIVVNHCGHAVQKALNDGGIESNEQNDIENHSSYMWLPTTIFINIIFQNPHGEYIKRE